MKSKILALSKNEEFKKLLQQKKVSNKYVTIYFGYLNNKNKNRFNISFVTKKKIGNAVKRNKIKRRLRNIMNDVFKKISKVLTTVPNKFKIHKTVSRMIENKKDTLNKSQLIQIKPFLIPMLPIIIIFMI